MAIIGFLGGTLSGGLLPDSRPVSASNVHQSILQRLGYDPSIEELFSDEIDHLKAHLKTEYRELTCRPEQRAQLIDWTTRQASWISATFDVAESFLPIAYPFYYRPLLKFMFNLPRPLLKRQKLYRYWLRRCSQTERLSSGTASLQTVRSRSSDSTPAVVNWRARIERSSEWLMEMIDRYCDDTRLRKVCSISLDNALTMTPTRQPCCGRHLSS